MTFESELRSHLLGDSGIAAAVADRVYPVMRPPTSPFPAITYIRVSGVPQTNMAGDDGKLMNIRVQIDAWSRTHDEAKVLAELIRNRMAIAASAFKSVMTLDQDFYETEVKVFRVMMDFSCWYRVL